MDTGGGGNAPTLPGNAFASTHCADLSDQQYREYLASLKGSGIGVFGGKTQVQNQNGSFSTVGTETYYDEHAFDFLISAGRMADAGVKAAMVLTAPEWLAAGGAWATVELAGEGVTTLGLQSAATTITGPGGIPLLPSTPTTVALGNLIGWGREAADAIARAGQITQEYVENLARAGMTSDYARRLAEWYERAAASGRGGDTAPVRAELMRKIADALQRIGK